MQYRWQGVSSLIGGAIIAIAALLMAQRPPGVPGGPHRQADDLGLALLAGTLLLLPGILAITSDQPPGWPRQVATVAVVLAAAGLAISLLAILGQAARLPVAWPLPIMGVIGIWIATLLSGCVALASRRLPQGVAVLLVVGSIVLFFFNTEDARALLALPFALAWIVAGYVIFSTWHTAIGAPQAPASLS